MASSSAQFHESVDDLRAPTRDRHRATVSLTEELEAVDWYDQRIDAASDDDLRAILRHNRDEEKEHASMLVEWLRRQDATWDRFLRTYLFTGRPIAAIAQDPEAAAAAGDGGDGAAPGSARQASLGVGRPRGQGAAVMDHLGRELAPISDDAWSRIDEEAARTLRTFLAGRPLIEVTGPLGWDHGAATLGRARPASPSPGDHVEARVRDVQPLVELRAPFELSLDELDAADRGAPDPDLTPVIEAARHAALAEDGAVFHGYAAAGIRGMTPASPHASLSISDDYDDYPGIVARAVAKLRAAGVGGPYAIALGSRCYTGVIETTEHGGYPVLEHIRLILGGPVVWAPGVNGAVVLSQRGGDYELVSGQDHAIGYSGHDNSSVRLYLEESFTFVVRDERAAVALTYPD